MNNISLTAIRNFALAFSLALLLYPTSLLAQQSGPRGNQIVDAPSELMAVLPSAPDPTPENWSSSNAEAYVGAAAPIMPFVAPEKEARPHRFWDRENRTLFALTAAGAAADFCVTRANLANGGKELNPVTRIFSGSTPALAANFALGTASVVGISYMFHKTGHHRLERLTSVINIGSSAGAVAYGLAHR